jgi:hypothetical protein
MNGLKNLITAFVPTSPVRSNPSTEIISKTLESIRFHFPDINIIVACDGVRQEQRDMERDYFLFQMQLMQKWFHNGVFPYPSVRHRHQVGMMRELMGHLRRTPLILFCEHDTPLVTDEPIEWGAIIHALLNYHFHFVRFLPETKIHPEHEHLMVGTQVFWDAHFTKTIQFSARPHLASREFYLRALEQFSPDANCFIEDQMHSVCERDPWEVWRMAIYTPPGNAKRSLHLDGRAGEDKYEGAQVF